MLALEQGAVLFRDALAALAVAVHAVLLVKALTQFQIRARTHAVVGVHGEMLDVIADIGNILNGQGIGHGEGQHDRVVPIAGADVRQLLDGDLGVLTGDLRVGPVGGPPALGLMADRADQIDLPAIGQIRLEMQGLFDLPCGGEGVVGKERLAGGQAESQGESQDGAWLHGIFSSSGGLISPCREDIAREPLGKGALNTRGRRGGAIADRVSRDTWPRDKWFDLVTRHRPAGSDNKPRRGEYKRDDNGSWPTMQGICPRLWPRE